MPDERERQRDPGDRPDGEAERRPLVVVECGERTRHQPAVDLGDGGDDDPGQERCGLAPRVVVRRERAGDPVRPGDRDGREDGERQGEPGRPCSDLVCEPVVLTGGDEPRQDDHAQGSGDEDERQVDAVGGEEAVRLYAVPKLARENDSEHRGRRTDGHGRDPRQQTAANSPLTA